MMAGVPHPFQGWGTDCTTRQRVELISINKLDESFADKLPESVRSAYL